MKNPQRQELEETNAKKLFGKRVLMARKEAGLTQADLGATIGTDKTRIAHYEKGDSAPTFEGLLELANQLRVSLDWLCGREDAHPLANGGEPMEESTLAQRVANLEADVRVLERVLKFHLGVLAQDLDHQKQRERAAGAPSNTSDETSGAPS